MRGYLIYINIFLHTLNNLYTETYTVLHVSVFHLIDTQIKLLMKHKNYIRPSVQCKV